MKKSFITTTVASAAIAAIALAGVATSGAQAAGQPAGAGSVGLQRAVAAARAHGNAFGLDNDQVLQSKSVTTDADGTTHARFDRTFKGLPVIGGDLVVHTDKAGGWKGVNAASTAVRVASTTPIVAGAAAAQTAARTADFTVNTSMPTLAVYAINGPARLVWKTQVDGLGAHHEPAGKVVFVDARSGDVVDGWATEQTDTGSGQSLYLGTVPVEATLSGGSFQLIDGTRGGARTEDANNAATTTTSGTLYTDADNAWGTGSNSNRQTAAVDAAFGVAKTWDFYKNVFGRNGIKNNGVAAKSLVHVGSGWVNASWSDTCFCMRYGDGSGSYTPLVSLDVAGHEMTHGVTSATAGLTYSRESGGLNESTSDVFGTMVEFYAANAADQGDYLIGEKINTSGTPLRWMDKPSKDGASADCWSKRVGSLDVHYSSGVGNHLFYLLSEGTGSKVIGGVTHSATACNGATLTGIGHDAAAAIWYGALTTYWTSSTNYAGARTGMLSAAKDLYGAGSTQYNATAAAWSGVGVN
ncbi:M4 family metallopeptidase [Terrabacter sp. 2RAF25]|uniref:M4 family metallopeptidase n=1 Tax=Terrabacter sp. 2RAF25 TaxID=3232998 RepID=UPI003F98EB20